MSLYKRGEIWWVSFTTPGGQRIRQSAQTASKQQAQEFHDRLKVEYWRIEKTGAKPRYKWQHAVERWLTEKQGGKSTLSQDKQYFRWLHPHFYDLYLDEINRDLIDRVTHARIADGVANGTVNRMLALVRALLRCAERHWEWIERAPFVRMLPEPKKRIRWLTHDEANRLLEELPEHLAEMMRFTLATGLREANVAYLQWSQVDRSRQCAWIHADQAKARKAIAVPLNADALAVLKRQEGRHKDYVFTYSGKPVTGANNRAWKRALIRAGIENFRWHDLRHTWASWHVQQGTPLHVLQELGGWSDPSMVQRYAHLSASHLKVYADQLKQCA